jgi:cytidylate kinase
MKKVLTLSRELGSGGIAIAQHLAEQLHWKLIDKEVITEIAKLAQCPESEIAQFDQEEFSRMKMLFNDLSFPSSGNNLVFPYMGGGFIEPYWMTGSVNDPQIIDESKYLELSKNVITNLADKGNVIIVGRGGCVLLKDRHDTLNLRIVAPLEERIKRVSEVSGISLAEAKESLHKRDKGSADYMHYFYQVNWADPLLYHLVINTGRFTLEEIEKMIGNCLLANN